MLNKILLFILKQRLKSYKHDAKWYENQGCYNNWYHEQGIPDLEQQIQELEIKIKNPNQKTFCYCPDCNNELISCKSFVSDEEVVTYKCSKCGRVSEWDFDAPCPVLLKDEEQ